jgi:hypothetical protein
MRYSNYYKRLLSKLGYYDYQSRLIFRHLNQEGGWDSHNENCRRFILRALELYKPEKVTVLGSGWLLELPLAELAERTDKVFLVDIVHPPDVVSQTAVLKNVVLVENDVTGGLIEEVCKELQNYPFLKRMKSLENIKIPEYKPDFDPGLVISLNILTQLESLPVDYLRSRARIPEEEYSRFRSAIQGSHLGFLKKHPSILISDTAEIFTDRKGQEESVPTLLTELPSGRLTEHWTWDFDLKGIDNYTRRSVMNVIAVAF